MLTALARCWSAALMPTRRGLTSMAMSRRPPACRAVTTPVSPGLVAMATPTGISTGTVAAARAAAGLAPTAGVLDGAGAGGGLGVDEGRRDAGGTPGGFDPGLVEGSGTGRLPVSLMKRGLGLSVPRVRWSVKTAP